MSDAAVAGFALATSGATKCGVPAQRVFPLAPAASPSATPRPRADVSTIAKPKSPTFRRALASSATNTRPLGASPIYWTILNCLTNRPANDEAEVDADEDDDDNDDAIGDPTGDAPSVVAMKNLEKTSFRADKGTRTG